MTDEIQTTQRIAGYDLARAVAIFGMVVHHFELSAVIALSVRLAESCSQSLIMKAMIATGQMALTWYVGLGTLVALDVIGNQLLGTAVCHGCSFFVMAVCCSAVWKQHFRRGPLEWALRTMTG